VTANVYYDSTKLWGIAWLALAFALALHVADEALTGFLPVYNSVVESVRAAYPWIPLPTFTFPVWLGGLALGVILLFAVSPLVFAGRRWLRAVSYVLAVIMIANGLGHIGASLYWARFAPGVYSSPILLLTAIALFRATYLGRIFQPQ